MKSFTAAGLGQQVLWDIVTNKESFEVRNKTKYVKLQDVEQLVLKMKLDMRQYLAYFCDTDDHRPIQPKDWEDIIDKHFPIEEWFPNEPKRDLIVEDRNDTLSEEQR